MWGRGWVVVMLSACGPGPAGSDATTGGSSTGEVVTTIPTEGSGEGESSTGTTGDMTEAASTGSSTTEPFDPNDCGAAQTPYPISPANVVFVVDKSGSMLTPWDHDNDDPDDDGLTKDMTPATPKQPRWISVHQELAAMTQTYDAALNSGLSLVPSKAATNAHNAAACPVEAQLDVPLGPAHAGAVIAGLPAEDDGAFAGATPTTKGIAAAVAALQAGGELPGSIVLLTDGAANCRAGAQSSDELLETYDVALPAAVADAFAQGISTHVFGIDIVDALADDAQDSEPDGVNTREVLDELAIAGGAPLPANAKYHNVLNQKLLAQELERIAPKILNCSFSLPEAAAYADYVVIHIDDVDWGRPWVEDCAAEDGWLYTNAEKTEIQLCGDMCAAFGKAATADVQFRCPND